MDDVDGGRRGLRARPEAGLLRALGEHWGLGGLTVLTDIVGAPIMFGT